MSDRNSENLVGNRGYSAISGSEVGREGSGGANASGGPVEWGPAIAVDGKRPGWLGLDQKILPIVPGKPDLVERLAGNHVWDLRGVKTTQIHLPADHPHYRQTAAAIPEGMKAWDGGDAAPADWNGKEVLMRNGSMIDPKGARDAFTWQHTTRDDTRRMPVFDIVAYTPVAAPIDWSGELEAVHEDGRTIGVKVIREGSDGARHVAASCSQPPKDWKDGYHKFDGTSFAPDDPWRIRNVRQPTPQADTKPDLTARMEALVRRMNETGSLHYAKSCDPLFDEARAIVALLPEPVDPDLIEAREIAAAYINASVVDVYSGGYDSSPEVACALMGLKRRALALAGEKEA